MTTPKEEGKNFAGMKIITDPTMKPGEWKLEAGVITSNPPPSPTPTASWEEGFDKIPMILGVGDMNRKIVKQFIHSTVIPHVQREMLKDMLGSIGSQHWRTLCGQDNTLPAATAMSMANENEIKWMFVIEYAKSLGISLEE